MPGTTSRQRGGPEWSLNEQVRPDWLKVRFRDGERYRSTLGPAAPGAAHTVCEEALPEHGRVLNAARPPS
jgi:lipoate synthase